jgi:hypothetical protein
MTVYENKKVPINTCPYCGSSAGFFIRQQVTGSISINFNYDGSDADNTEMYDYLTHKGGKVAYCQDCEKKLFNMSEIEE